jgi:hypothetical protein
MAGGTGWVVRSSTERAPDADKVALGQRLMGV